MKRLHSRSCFLDSLVEVTGLTHDYFVARVGERLEDGFPVQLLVEPLWDAGFALTPFYRYPAAMNPETGEVKPCFDDCESRWARVIADSLMGVVCGKSKNGIQHAVPLFGGEIRFRPFGFDPEMLWRVSCHV